MTDDCRVSGVDRRAPPRLPDVRSFVGGSEEGGAVVHRVRVAQCMQWFAERHSVPVRAVPVETRVETSVALCVVWKSLRVRSV